MEKLSVSRPAGGITPTPEVVLALLGLRDTAGGAEGSGLASQIAAERGRVEPIFGLDAAERIAMVVDNLQALPAEEAAAILDLSPDSYQAMVGRARERLEASGARRAVILEDDWFGRRRLEQACADHGVDIAASTADPSLTVGAALAYRPGIALIDLAIDGDELAGEIAAMAISERCPECRVVLVTGYDNADRIAALMPNSEALVKPFSSNALGRVLKGRSAR